ncbi:MAG: response regulator transcription factor [Anaerolineales bacterium]|nr:response regulator transcription factor [Anaerolineales bacterium]
MKGNILVVDDEEAARQSLADILRLEGYQVKTAANGEAAVKSLEGDEFDLMLLDLKMPGMSGLDVMTVANEEAPETQIILLTAHGSMDSAIKALRRGANDYLLKPAAPKDILTSVSKAMEERSETERRKRLIGQIESSIQQLKDADGVELPAPVEGTNISLGGGIKVDLERREIWLGDQKENLTPGEGKLMKVLIENQGRVLTHRELVSLVQGYQTTDWEAPEILRPLVSRLRRKLANFPDGETWIVNVRGTGYVFDGVGGS